MANVVLTTGESAIVDDEDIPHLSHLKWKPLRCKNGSIYAVARIYQGDRVEKTVYMHRLLVNTSADQLVDHRNGNGLDNRRENLRIATKAQNAQNVGMRRTSKSGYKGIKADGQRWRASITVNGKRINLGSFKNKEDAARAYDTAAHKYFGAFAKVNFPTE